MNADLNATRSAGSFVGFMCFSGSVLFISYRTQLKDDRNLSYYRHQTLETGAVRQRKSKKEIKSEEMGSVERNPR